MHARARSVALIETGSGFSFFVYFRNEIILSDGSYCVVSRITMTIMPEETPGLGSRPSDVATKTTGKMSSIVVSVDLRS